MESNQPSGTRKTNLSSSLEIFPPSIARHFHRGQELSVYYRPDAVGTWAKHQRAQTEIAFLFGSAQCRVGYAVDDLSWVEQDLRGPQVCVIGAGVEHECRIAVPCELLVLYVDQGRLQKSAFRKINGVQISNAAQHNVAIWMLASLLRHLCSARLRPEPRTVDAIGGELARSLFGLLRDESASSPPAGLCLTASQRERVMRYIESNLKHDIHVVDLAKQTGHSLSHFTELFLNTMGRPPYRYLKEVRVLRGYEMLLTGDYLAREVALAVGYSNPDHFGEVFQKFCGYSPRELLRRVRTGSSASPFSPEERRERFSV